MDVSEALSPGSSPLSNRVTYAQAYAWFLIFFFLAPTFRGVLRSDGLYIDAVLQVLYSAAFLFVLLLFLAHKRVSFNHFLLAALLTLALSLLISVAIWRDASRTIVSDLFEFQKPLFAALIFITTLLIRWDDGSVRRVARAYVIIVSIAAVYSVFEALGGEFAHRLSVLLYKSTRASLVGKATGTFGVTYFFASFMVFGLVFSASLFLYLRRLRYLLLAAVALFSVLLSQSRAAAIALAGLALCIYVTYWAYRNFSRKLTFYGASTAVLLLLALLINSVLPVFQNLPYLYGGLARLLEQGVDAAGTGSFNARYQQLLFAVESQDDIPLVGVGIGKGYARYLESYYALYLYRYGAVGILLSLGVFVIFFREAVKAFNTAIRRGERENACFFLALHLWMYAFPILSLSSVIHDQVKFAILFYGGLAIMLSYNRMHGKAAATVRKASYA